MTGVRMAARGSREAYLHHRRVMQHYTYQRTQRHPGTEGQWFFGMPTHLMELEALTEAYPDALFIQTHREAVQFMGSWCSLVERIRSNIGEPRPPEVLGAEQLRAMGNMLDRAVGFRESHPELEDRWIDVSYYDLGGGSDGGRGSDLQPAWLATGTGGEDPDEHGKTEPSSNASS